MRSARNQVIRKQWITAPFCSEMVKVVALREIAIVSIVGRKEEYLKNSPESISQEWKYTYLI